MALTAARPIGYDEAIAYHVGLWDPFRAHAYSLFLFPWNMNSPEWGQPFHEVRSPVWTWSLARAPGAFDTANKTGMISSITKQSFLRKSMTMQDWLSQHLIHSLSCNKGSEICKQTHKRNLEEPGFLANVWGKSQFILHLKQALSRSIGLSLGNTPKEDLGLYPLTSDDRDKITSEWKCFQQWWCVLRDIIKSIMAILSIQNSLERLPCEKKRLWYAPVHRTDFPEVKNTSHLSPALKNTTGPADSWRNLQFLMFKGHF